MRHVLAFSVLATYIAADFTESGDQGCGLLGIEESM
jgi:hypothetical protein